MLTFASRRMRAVTLAQGWSALRAGLLALVLALAADIGWAQELTPSADSAPLPANPQGAAITPYTESWLQRPMSAGIFVGVLQGSPFFDDWVGQTQGMIGGLRLGYDIGEHFGVEMRYAFGSTQLYDTQRALTARTLVDPNINQPAQGLEYSQTRHSDRDLVDFSVLWYANGDARCRLYFLTGIGLAQIRFTDVMDDRWSKTVPDIPLGVGLKYHCSELAALRLELNDTIIFGNGAFNTLHDVSLTGGLELRFGGSKRAYWPWVPSNNSW